MPEPLDFLIPGDDSFAQKDDGARQEFMENLIENMLDDGVESVSFPIEVDRDGEVERLEIEIDISGIEHAEEFWELYYEALRGAVESDGNYQEGAVTCC